MRGISGVVRKDGSRLMINLEIWSRLFLDWRGHEDVSGDLTERGLSI